MGADAIVYDEATGGKLKEIGESGGGKTPFQIAPSKLQRS